MVLGWLELARQTGPFFSGADEAVPIPVSDNTVYRGWGLATRFGALISDQPTTSNRGAAW